MTQISRRKFIKRVAACSCASMAYGMAPGFKVPSAFASSGNGNKLLIINLNGGWDGLHICQPKTGSVYTTLASMRPTLKTAPGSLLSLTSDYGLHPSFTTLKSLYDEGHLAAIMKVGYDNMSRSHLDAEVTYARGVSDRLSSTASGFINRVGAAYGWNSLQAMSVDGPDPAFEGGQYRGVQVNDLGSFEFSSDNTQPYQETNYRKSIIYSLSQSRTIDANKPKQADAASGITAAIDYSGMVQTAIDGASFPTSYPNTYFGRSLKDIDILFSTPSLGTQLGYVRRGGFDTHADQITNFNSTLPELNNGLAAFVANMKAKNLWNNLTIMIVSEFGRTNQENGSDGTDHGGGALVFLSGGLVQSGVYGDITVSDLADNPWLPMQYNIIEIYRQVFAKMGYDPDAIFETSSGPSLSGLFV